MKEDFLERFRKDPEDPLDEQLPSLEEVFRAIEAPHDADAHVLKYLAARPEMVESIENIKDVLKTDDYKLHFAPQPLIERIRAELEKRKAQGEKGGELSL